MKKVLLLGLILILSISFFGCNAKPSIQKDLSSGTQLQNSLKQDPPDSSADAGSTKHVQSNTDIGGKISIHGKTSASSLCSLDFIDGNTGWAVEHNSGLNTSFILSTVDAGEHWTNTSLGSITANKLVFIDKLTGWLITQSEGKDTAGNDIYTMKILCTQDGGKSFKVQWEGKTGTSSACDLWFQDASRGYALVNDTLLLTKDGGKRWSAASFGIGGFIPQHMDFTGVDTVYIIGKAGKKNDSETKIMVLRTANGGSTWQKQFEKSYPNGPIGSIDIDFADAAHGWFLTSNMDTMSGDLYYTSNSGRNWKKINEIRCGRPYPAELDFVTPETGWIPVSAGAGPIDGGMMVTRDGGKNFEMVDHHGAMTNMLEVHFTSAQKGFAIGTEPGYGDYLVRTVDGGKTWAEVYPEIKPTKDISFVDSLHGFGLGQLSDPKILLYTGDGGDTWKSVKKLSDDFYLSKLSFIDKYNGWILAASASSNNTVILKTSDGGNTWISLNNNVLKSAYSSPFYFRFFDHDNGIISTMSGAYIVFYRTQDGGRTWHSSNQEQIDNITRQVTFISAKQGWEIDFLRSSNTINLSIMENGSSWQPLKQVGTGLYSYSLNFISKDRGWILAGDPSSVSRGHMKLLSTTDGGKTWASQEFPDGFLLDTLDVQIPIEFTDEQHGWILSLQGLLKTDDGGMSWKWE